MNRLLSALAGMAMLLLLITGCTPRHTVVLIADPDGHVGQAEVSTAGGKQLLEKTSEMTTVSGKAAAPAPVSVASPEFIAATFGEAMAVMPPPPEKFILFFETGTTVMIPESRATMAAALEAIKRRRAISISVSGHADAAGSQQLNEKLSYSRAQSIRDQLVQQGVDAERIIVSSHGKGNPLVPATEGVAEPRNRRVEVIVR
jgi:outer membrane protein OmpA-like peptidoglycan-associated protein